MNNIISEDGTYISNCFKGENGTWKLIGTEKEFDTKGNPIETNYQDRNKNWKYTSVGKNTIDKFKNIHTGEYLNIVRIVVYRMAEQGKIKADIPF